jgi:hypothetical protein
MLNNEYDRNTRDTETHRSTVMTFVVEKAPDGPDWMHEIKFDGYRMHAGAFADQPSHYGWLAAPTFTVRPAAASVSRIRPVGPPSPLGIGVAPKRWPKRLSDESVRPRPYAKY